MNLIFKKRLKRKNILEGRIKCHGNKSNCFLEHRVAGREKELVEKIN